MERSELERSELERVVFVYTAYPSLVEAETAGRALIEQRLAACVNILPGMVSHYWWDGKVERGEEVVVIVKTRATLVSRFRGSPYPAAHSEANFGIKGTLANQCF